jgi:hypothetical protein
MYYLHPRHPLPEVYMALVMACAGASLVVVSEVDSLAMALCSDCHLERPKEVSNLLGVRSMGLLDSMALVTWDLRMVWN